ncbi:MAG TPA: hypothetical protein VHM88_01595 [Candidatus Acidoferrales bacterium]|nr:hypothetical protein [Candidatus Acidoferrales bacterium]
MTPKGDRRRGNWFARLLRERTVQAGIVVWVAFSGAIPFLSRGTVPFNRPSLAGLSYRAEVLAEILGPVIAFVFIAVGWALTRRRTIPDIAARIPEKPIALRETVGLILYGAVVLIAGQFVGRLVGTHGIGLHLPGSMFGLSDAVTPREAYAWSVYNFVFYAAIPYLVFRIRGYSREALCLKSSNLRNDTLVILVILAMTCLGGLLRGLTPRQLSVAGGLALALSLLGTGLPIMIFLCAILVPRFKRLTGSTASAVVLGGFTYAGLHLADSWTRYDTLAHGALSVIFIVLLYGGPGLVKAYLTLRTGNAWVHLWGYHVIAPHVTTDTPIFAHIFRLR